MTIVLFFNELFAEVNRLLAVGRTFHYWATEPLVNLLSWNKPTVIAGAGVLGSTWEHKVICLEGPSGFSLQELVGNEKGKCYFRDQLGERGILCSSVMDGLWNQARWVRVLGLGETWECHNQLKLAGNLAPGKALLEFGVWLCLYFWGSFPCRKRCWALSRCINIRCCVQALGEPSVANWTSMARSLSLTGLEEGSLSGRRLWETRKRGLELGWLWLFWQPVLSWIMFSILLGVSARLERNWDFLCSRLINEWRCLHNAGRSPFGVLLANSVALSLPSLSAC